LFFNRGRATVIGLGCEKTARNDTSFAALALGFILINYVHAA
jgi:hypothetical protein